MRLIAVLVSCAIAGCSSVQLYLAEDQTQGTEGKHCGNPYGWWASDVGGGTVSIKATPCPEGLCGNATLHFPKASQVLFAGSAVELTADGHMKRLQLIDWRTRESVEPGQRVPAPTAATASPMYIFISQHAAPDRIVVSLPALIVDDQHITIPSARMVLAERRKSFPCLQ